VNCWASSLRRARAGRAALVGRHATDALGQRMRVIRRNQQDVFTITQLGELEWRTSCDNRAPVRQRRVECPVPETCSFQIRNANISVALKLAVTSWGGVKPVVITLSDTPSSRASDSTRAAKAAFVFGSEEPVRPPTCSN